MWHIPTEIFDLASVKLENWKKKKTHRVWLQKRKHLIKKLISKWEIHIKDTFKNPMYLEIKCPLLNDGYILKATTRKIRKYL